MAKPSGRPVPAPHRTRSALWLAVAVLALSGCGATTTSTPVAAPAESAAAGKAVAPTGKAAAPANKAARSAPSSRPTPKAARSTLITDAPNHFSVRLPAGYKRLTKANVKALLKAGGAANPQLKPIIDQYASVGDRARVFAYKPGAGGTNVNVLTIPTKATSKDLETLYAGVKPVVEKVGARITAHGVERLAGTKAMRIEYRLSMSTMRMRGTQVYLIHRGKVIVMTITQPDVDASTADAKAILGSLRLQ